MPTYPNLPSAYQYDLARDGTWVFMADGNGMPQYTFSAGDVDSLAAWSSTNKYAMLDNVGNKIVALFPGPRQISAVLHTFWRSTTGSWISPAMAYSFDTTNGTNGSWTTFATPGTNQITALTAAQQRSLVYNVIVPGVKGVRVATTASTSQTWYQQSFMIWGTTQPIGLVFWHPSSDIPLFNSDNNLDRGDIYTNQAPAVQQIRIKNTGSQTANNVVVSMDMSNAQSAIDTDTTFSLDGTNFAATQTIASIGSGTISAVVYMKRGTPTDAAGTTRTAAMRAVATTWT